MSLGLHTSNNDRRDHWDAERSVSHSLSLSQHTSKSIAAHSECLLSIRCREVAFSLIRCSYVAFFALNVWFVLSFIFHSYTKRCQMVDEQLMQFFFRSGRLLQTNIKNNTLSHVWALVFMHATNPLTTNTQTYIELTTYIIMTVIRSVRFHWCGNGSANYPVQK